MQLCLKGSTHVCRCAAESDKYPAWRNPVDVQALRLQPAGHAFDILLGESEALPNLGRSEPAMVVRRSGVLLVCEQLFEGRLLLRGSRQNDCHLIQHEL